MSVASKASPPTLVREVGWVALQARSWSPGLCILLAPPDLPAQREGSKERRGGQSHPGSVLGLRRPPPVPRMLGAETQLASCSPSVGMWRGLGAAHAPRASPTDSCSLSGSSRGCGPTPEGASCPWARAWPARSPARRRGCRTPQQPAASRPGPWKPASWDSLPCPHPVTPLPPPRALPEDSTQDAGAGAAVGTRTLPRAGTVTTPSSR